MSSFLVYKWPNGLELKLSWNRVCKENRMRFFFFVLVLLTTSFGSAALCLKSGRFEYSMRVLAEKKSLNVISFNLENMKLTPGSKGREQTMARAGMQAQVIRKIEKNKLEAAADLILVQDMIGVGSGKKFVSDFLGQREAKMSEPLHERGMVAGQFVSAGKAFKYEMRSHADARWKDALNESAETLFRKGLSSMIVRPAGAPAGALPIFISISVHLKSMRDSEGDPKSRVRRTAQVKYLVDQVVAAHRKKFGENVPIIIGGDTNAYRKAPELQPIHDAGFKDVFDIVGLSERARSTHFYFKNDLAKGEGHQLDKIYVSPTLASLVQLAGVHRYQLEAPRSIVERSEQPSDHYPIFASFDFAKLFKAYKVAVENKGWH